MDDIQKRANFSYIRYSNCWEDAEILCDALRPAEGSRILSIASAGDNSLSLLSRGADVVAVDLNIAQLACLDLRCVVIKNLNYEEGLAFLGFASMKDRLKVFEHIKNHLKPESKNFFENNLQIIADGVIHCGKFERYFQLFRTRMLSLVHSKKTIQELLSSKEKKEREGFYQQKWANKRWHWLFKIFFSKFIMGKMGRDPEFFRYVEVPVAQNILKRTQYALTELDPSQNPYLKYILTGNFGETLPDYLSKNNYENIRQNLSRLTIFQGTFQEAAVKFGENKFDGFNLSDIFEYLDEPTCVSIYQILLKNSNKGARFAYWNMLVPRSCPDRFLDKVAYKEEISKKLFLQDQAFFYSDFRVEEVL